MQAQKKDEEQIIKYIKEKQGQPKDEAALKVQIEAEFKKFSEEVIPELKALLGTQANNKKAQNVYQLAGASRLSAANAITRTFNTKLGLLWESVAALAPNVVSPEIEWKYKIEEVDVIVLYNDKLYYTQLKTQKNTLTGSQRKRTIEELKKYENPWFVACIETACKSTMPTRQVTCLIGNAFWSKIDIPYEFILEKLKELIQDVEQLLAQPNA